LKRTYTHRPKTTGPFTMDTFVVSLGSAPQQLRGTVPPCVGSAGPVGKAAQDVSSLELNTKLSCSQAMLALLAAGGTSLAVGNRRSRRSQTLLAKKARKYETYPAENVLGEKDACGVGMIANLEKAPSSDLLQAALRALSCVEHRGACSSGMDSNIQLCGGDDSGDGAGVMTQIPWELFSASVTIPEDHNNCAVGMLFLSKDPAERIKAKHVLETALGEEGFDILGYRIVPVDSSVPGARSKATEPWIEQIFVHHPTLSGQNLESKLYIARKTTESALTYDSLYVASFSTQTIVYKGMLKSTHLRQYYLDLHTLVTKCNMLCGTGGSAPTPCLDGHLPSLSA